MAKPRNKSPNGGSGGLRLAAVNGSPVDVSASSDAASLPPATKGAPPVGPITAAEVAAMGDEALRAMRSAIQADLAVVTAEYQARQEALEQEVKRLRRAVVDVEARIPPGAVLLSEAGTSIAYTYSGTPWKLTAAAAKQRGMPDLAGKLVCYAYGRPIVADGRLVAPGKMTARPSPLHSRSAPGASDDVRFW